MKSQAAYDRLADVPPSVLLETLAERLPVGVILLRAGGVIWANAQALQVFDGAPERIVPHVADAFSGRELRNARVTVDGDRRKIVVEATAAPLDGPDRTVVVVVSDVTRRDRVERAEAEFVENAAHQLRNPIAAIAASVDALKAGARDDPPERDRFLAHIERESARIGTLVEALLALAVLQGGDGRSNVEIVPLRRLLEGAAGSASRRARIAIDCPEDVAVVSDGALLAQAIGNVVANAVQHATSEVRVEAHVEGAMVVVEVGDDGPGVPAEVGERIFERFFRGPGASDNGSGLGLAIASAAAAAAQGTLELLPPSAGAGATFRLTVPGAQLL